MMLLALKPKKMQKKEEGMLDRRMGAGVGRAELVFLIPQK